ncbi:MAG TPA: nucleotide sugar dehydrogenase [Sedimentisphaerales bacterium]|nr:nucleotide sugar dehydrogenase [Sedimentisphaerales bacterium]HNU29421.1 nucleotide sugar dehydrogenase [Sedimentisphaerales bacterium]
MRVCVVGVGYVGLVSAACLAREGHTVVGVDSNDAKATMINSGLSPIVEKETPELVQEGVRRGALRATTEVEEAVRASELTLICVGTPGQANGDPDLSHVRRVCVEIGRALRAMDDFHVVVCRSTVLPGTIRGVVIPLLEEHSGKRAGRDFGVCHNPEFLREGTAVYDFYHPPKTVIGEGDRVSGDRVASLYAMLDAPLFHTRIEVSEMIKYVDNAWHALKICFANEMGDLSRAMKIDSHAVMDIFCQDTKLNLSDCYLRPGFAFGGSCLPKDVRALAHRARRMDLDLPVLNAIVPSNQMQIDTAVRMITELGKKKIGILGFSFKAGTDDLRESPLVTVIERLLGKGYDIRVYDRNVNMARLMGANRDYLLNHIPHISKLMVETIDEVLHHAEVIVVGNRMEDCDGVVARLKGDQVVVDLVRVASLAARGGEYRGICW